MLLAILLILFQTGTTDLQILLTTEFSERRQIFLWIAFFASFAVKVPMVPVHIWLPEAHVEAPTAGSVILAGILLKLGTYGFLRFSIPMFPEATLCFTPFIYTLSAIAIIYTSLTTLRQIDLKKIIAYSSVAHMNLVTIGMFSLNIQGIGGSILLMLSHGLVSSALFLCVGVLYDRHKTRLVRYYGGLVSTMPNFSTIFFFFTLANMSLPGTSSFIGEFLILVGAFQRNSLVATLAALGMILGAAYSLWLYNRVVSGNLKPDFLHKFSDLNGREVFIFIPFLVGVVWMGVYPKVFPDCMHTSVSNLVQHGKFHWEESAKKRNSFCASLQERRFGIWIGWRRVKRRLLSQPTGKPLPSGLHQVALNAPQSESKRTGQGETIYHFDLAVSLNIEWNLPLPPFGQTGACAWFVHFAAAFFPPLWTFLFLMRTDGGDWSAEAGVPASASLWS